METCSRCGAEFDLTRVKRRIGHLYGAGQYNDYFPGGDVCDTCAIVEMSPDYGTGEDNMEDMGSSWDD